MQVSLLATMVMLNKRKIVGVRYRSGEGVVWTNGRAKREYGQQHFLNTF